MNHPEGAVTQLLVDVKAGNAEAKAALVESLYPELHRLAAAQMRRERPGHTLQPTALINEAYPRVLGGAQPALKNRQHVLARFAVAMQRVLIDHVRSHAAGKRRGKNVRVPLDSVMTGMDRRMDVEERRPRRDEMHDSLLINEALEAFAGIDPRAARVVKLRFFEGRTNKEIAGKLNISERSVERDWDDGRLWLLKRLSSE